MMMSGSPSSKSPVSGTLGNGRVHHLGDALVEDHRHRRQGHGDGDGGGQQGRQGRADHAGPDREGQQHEGELAALGQGGGDGGRAPGRGAEQPGQAEQDQELQRHQAQHQADQHQGLAGHQLQVDAGPDGDEEQAQQQAPERLDVGLQLAAELALGQHHPGQEGAEGGRQADGLHDAGHPDHDQQGGGGEDLAQAGLGDEAEDRPHQIAAAADHGAHGGEHRQALGPGRQVGDQAGAAVAGGLGVDGGAMGQGRQQGEHRDHRQVLQQQDPEGGASDRALPQALLVEGLQHDGGGRHGQHHPDRQGRLPGQAQQHRDAGDGQRGADDLGAAEAEDRLAHVPQGRGLDLQPDQEQQDDHAELGELHDVGLLADQRQGERPDHHAGDQVAQHRAQAQALGDRHGDDGGAEIDQGLQ
jgi:hypothetical protein